MLKQMQKMSRWSRDLQDDRAWSVVTTLRSNDSSTQHHTCPWFPDVNSWLILKAARDVGEMGRCDALTAAWNRLIRAHKTGSLLARAEATTSYLSKYYADAVRRTIDRVAVLPFSFMCRTRRRTPPSGRLRLKSCRSAWASRKSAVSKPSVN
jgi:hypothetical protein